MSRRKKGKGRGEGEIPLPFSLLPPPPPHPPFDEGFLRYEFGGLIFGGAYFRNFTAREPSTFRADGDCNACSRVSFSLLSLRKMKTTRSLGPRAPHKVIIHALDWLQHAKKNMKNITEGFNVHRDYLIKQSRNYCNKFKWTESYPGIGESCEQIHGSNTRQINVQSSVNTIINTPKKWLENHNADTERCRIKISVMSVVNSRSKD